MVMLPKITLRSVSLAGLKRGICAKAPSQETYPAVGRLVHVALHLSGVGHQILHSSVLQSCWVRGREYGLYSATGKQKFQQ